jgi:hypothetical protein
MKAKEFVATLKKIATEYKTLYVYGCFGAPLKESTKARYTTESSYKYNKTAELQANVEKAVKQGNVFGFDCVCLIKGVLWGWNGNFEKIYGGASYKANGVPDVNADNMLKYCDEVSSDFSHLEPGEYLQMSGHCGVYIGEGLAVECTPKWDNCVQITAVGNIGKKPGYNTRTWEKHGKLQFVDYTIETIPEEQVPEEEPIIPETPVIEEPKKSLYYSFLLFLKKIIDLLISKEENKYGTKK